MRNGLAGPVDPGRQQSSSPTALHSLLTTSISSSAETTWWRGRPPPALDITNEELVRFLHLHAVWLAEAKLALSPDIPEILDLKAAKYPLKQEVTEVINRPSLVTAARAPMKRVLDQILALNGRQETRLDGRRG